MQACVNLTAALDPLGHFPGDDSFGNGKFIANAGGCLIDLGGGEFRLAAPVLIPEYVGNIVLGHGSLVADDAFPADSFLLVVGIEGSCRVPQGSCNVDLGFPELFLDGRRVASGLQINNVMGTTVGPTFYALNFSAYGVQINAGHEVMIDRAWLGETNFDYPFTQADPPKAIAIQINGNDHYVSYYAGALGRAHAASRQPLPAAQPRTQPTRSSTPSCSRQRSALRSTARQTT